MIVQSWGRQSVYTTREHIEHITTIYKIPSNSRLLGDVNEIFSMSSSAGVVCLVGGKMPLKIFFQVDSQGHRRG